MSRTAARSGILTLLVMAIAGGLAAGPGCGERATAPEPVSESPPLLSGFSPAHGEVGDSVTVWGTNFTLSPVGTTIGFGSASALALSGSDSLARIAVPSGAETGPLRLITPRGADTSDVYFIVISPSVPAPRIDLVEPWAAPAGTAVIIHGDHFDPRPPANHVSFNGILAPVTGATDSTILTIVPSGASDGPIQVVTSGGMTLAPGGFIVGARQDTCQGPTFVSGTIFTSTNWTLAGCPYVILDGITIAVPARLTIESGVVIKLLGDTTRIEVRGELVTLGDPSAPVVFTSYLDDEHAGDTNGDGAATLPATGDWNTVRFRSGGTGEFSHTEFLYGGAGGEGGLKIVSGVTVTDCTFGYHADYGLVSRERPSGTVITNCIFYGNGRPLLVHPGQELGTSNTFSAAGEPENQQNAIFLTPDSTQTGEIRWEETEVPFVLAYGSAGDNLFVVEGAVLNVSPGVTVKLWGKDTDLVIFGELYAVGEPDNRIIFTSFMDDVRGGDTNGDGVTSVPLSGDWDSIDLGVNSRATIHEADIFYGGARGHWSDGELSAADGCYADIRDCNISKSSANAIALFGGQGRVMNCTFADSDLWAIRCASSVVWYHWGGDVLLGGNTFAPGQSRVYINEWGPGPP